MSSVAGTRVIRGRITEFHGHSYVAGPCAGHSTSRASQLSSWCGIEQFLEDDVEKEEAEIEESMEKNTPFQVPLAFENYSKRRTDQEHISECGQHP